MSETGKSVLIVEDSAIQAFEMKTLLEGQGMRVLWAQNGQLGVLLAQRELPDLILLDLEMPVMGGLDACQQLKSTPQTAHIPIIILTAHNEPVMLKEGIDMGAIDFIPKDVFSGSVLLETLRQLKILGPIHTEEPAEEPLETMSAEEPVDEV